MFPNKRRQSTFIISTLLIVVFSAGLVAAHDTGQPHTHDPVEKVCDNCHAVDESLAPNDGTHAHVFQGLPKDHPPMAIVVASGDGKLYSLQWLLQHLRSIYSATESAAPRRYSHAHQHSHQHSFARASALASALASVVYLPLPSTIPRFRTKQVKRSPQLKLTRLSHVSYTVKTYQKERAACPLLLSVC